MFVWYAVELAEFRCRASKPGRLTNCARRCRHPSCSVRMGPFARVDERFKKVVLAAGCCRAAWEHGGTWLKCRIPSGWPMLTWLTHENLTSHWGYSNLWYAVKKLGRPLTSDFVEQPEAGNSLQFLFLIWASAHKRSWEPQPQTPLQALPVTATTLPLCRCHRQTLSQVSSFSVPIAMWSSETCLNSAGDDPSRPGDVISFEWIALLGFPAFAKGGGHFSTRLPICCLSNWDDSSINDQEGKDIDDWNPFLALSWTIIVSMFLSSVNR